MKACTYVPKSPIALHCKIRRQYCIPLLILNGVIINAVLGNTEAKDYDYRRRKQFNVRGEPMSRIEINRAQHVEEDTGFSSVPVHHEAVKKLNERKVLYNYEYSEPSPILENYSNYPVTPPTALPTYIPTAYPSKAPLPFPSTAPNDMMTTLSSIRPSNVTSTLKGSKQATYPSIAPLPFPSTAHDAMTTTSPSTLPPIAMSTFPRSIPTTYPSIAPFSIPSMPPSTIPTAFPSMLPSSTPSESPSAIPSTFPSMVPSTMPTSLPSMLPSHVPSVLPSSIPSVFPSVIPSTSPSAVPTNIPSTIPSMVPSAVPSLIPSSLPSAFPSIEPTLIPSASPTLSIKPTNRPSFSPSFSPTSKPSYQPSERPSMSPSLHPSSFPSSQPSDMPSASPTSSSAPTVPIQLVPISSFILELTLDSASVDSGHFLKTVDTHMTNVFQEYADPSLNFEGLTLTVSNVMHSTTNRKRIQVTLVGKTFFRYSYTVVADSVEGLIVHSFGKEQMPILLPSLQKLGIAQCNFYLTSETMSEFPNLDGVNNNKSIAIPILLTCIIAIFFISFTMILRNRRQPREPDSTFNIEEPPPTKIRNNYNKSMVASEVLQNDFEEHTTSGSVISHTQEGSGRYAFSVSASSVGVPDGSINEYAYSLQVHDDESIGIETCLTFAEDSTSTNFDRIWREDDEFHDDELR